ncbi:hypothetical protein BJ508DRAFT_64820 [Ascobolus immersus RN42]|uniref:Uncharacterized protein n=1 Tax=Ascobolus immersus RN42 TaxID=1160509 RepID=A0A3N4INU2_ASCIM|nr:hypothetical protein BJ508DRAFT_64820 [Ascobolus immersus RN42]
MERIVITSGRGAVCGGFIFDGRCHLDVPAYRDNSVITSSDVDFIHGLLLEYKRAGNASGFRTQLLSQIKEGTQAVYDAESTGRDIESVFKDILSDRTGVYWCQDDYCCLMPVWRVLLKVRPRNRRTSRSRWKWGFITNMIWRWDRFTENLPGHIHLQEMVASDEPTFKLKRKIMLFHESIRPKWKDKCGLYRMKYRNPGLDSHFYNMPYLLPHPDMPTPSILSRSTYTPIPYIKNRHHAWASQNNWPQVPDAKRPWFNWCHTEEAKEWLNIGDKYLDERIKKDECTIIMLCLMRKIVAEAENIHGIFFSRVYEVEGGIRGPNIATVKGLKKTIETIERLNDGNFGVRKMTRN